MIENFILVQDNFLTPQECSAGIELFKTLDSTGSSYTRQQSEGNISKTLKDDKAVTVLDPQFAICKTHLMFFKIFTSKFWASFDAYADRYPILGSYPKFHIFGGKIQRTDVGGGYHLWHVEDGNVEYSRRKFAFIVYLNDVEEGGETEFIYYPKRVQSKTGRLLLFPAGMTHAHRGNPPMSGEKYIFTGWVEI